MKKITGIVVATANHATNQLQPTTKIQVNKLVFHIDRERFRALFCFPPLFLLFKAALSLSQYNFLT
jgi:hypothetical protein